MKFFLTLVASEKPLTPAHIAVVMRYVELQGLLPMDTPLWLAPHKAADIMLGQHLQKSHVEALREALAADRIDFFITAAQGRRKRLLLADMDSTIVTSETLDDLAEHAGLRDQIAPITERAMRGEPDFKQALRERVAMLRGLPQESLAATLAAVKLMPGAKIFVQTMASQNALCILVSGGFTIFTGAVARQSGFHFHHGNTLGLEGTSLSGTVEEPILDRDAKLRFLQEYAARLGLGPLDALAIGDGANDLPMLQAAGLGIGFHPKPLLREELENCILYGDLTAALYAQGYRREEFVTEN